MTPEQRAPSSSPEPGAHPPHREDQADATARGARGRLQRLAQLVLRVLRVLEVRSPRVERTLMLVAVAIFVASAVVAWINFPDVDAPFRWTLLILVAVVLVPAGLAANAWEFMIIAQLVGKRARFGEAYRVTVLSTAANVLPIPGAVIVRTRALRQLGSGYRGAFASIAAVGFAWVGTSAALAAGFLLADGSLGLGLVSALGAICGIGMAIALLISQVGLSRTASMGAKIAIVELLSTILMAVRLWLVLRGLGIDAGWMQAFALALVAVVSSAVGIFPGGLGIREVLSGALSPLIGLPAAVGLAMSTVERIIVFISLTTLAMLLLWRGDGAGELEDQEVSEPDPLGRDSSPPG